MMIRVAAAFLSLVTIASAQADPWQQAEENARQAARAIHLANRNTFAWLSHADPTTGLDPRNLKDSAYWNAQDCAADNYPFQILTAYMTGNYYLQQNVRHILTQEQKYANRLDSLPDDFLFATQKFRTADPDITHLIFGAAEYAKDALMPVTEWLGPSPWLDRMQGLIADIWKHAPVDSPGGKLPSDDVEVNGDLLQCMGRLYWLTGKDQYKDWCFRLADHHLFEKNLLEEKQLRLRDHGCEIIGGLTETYVIALKTDPARAERYRPRLHALLDNILEHGLDENGLMYNAYSPKTGKPVNKSLDDGWGYVFNGILTIGLVDNEPRYRDAAKRALANVHKYSGNPWGHSIDDLADSTEGAINLMNRLPDASAAAWIDQSMEAIFATQRPDGTLEGWYGDGNSTRTALMYALWKTQGITASPWVEELQIGASREDDGTLRVWLRSGWNWSGHLRFDRPRHREVLHLPLDYPRINQFPEWFTVERGGHYAVQRDGGPAQALTAEELLSYSVSLKANQPLRMTVKPIAPPPSAGAMHETARPRGAGIASHTSQSKPATGVGTSASFEGPVGLQLWSLRDTLGKSVPLGLQYARDFGFVEVELAGTYGLTPAELHKRLQEHGLKAVSGHWPFADWEKDPEAVAKEAAEFGMTYAGCAWLADQGPFDEALCHRAARVFNHAGEVLAAHHIKFFYHNHGYEFVPHGDGTLFDVLMKETKPEFVCHEMDVFWTFHAGQDPVKLLKRYAGRWELLHIKDLKKGVPTGDLTGYTDEANDIPIGTGQIDYAKVLRVAQDLGVKHFFIEDESPNVLQQLPRSIRFLESLSW